MFLLVLENQFSKTCRASRYVLLFVRGNLVFKVKYMPSDRHHLRAKDVDAGFWKQLYICARGRRMNVLPQLVGPMIRMLVSFLRHSRNKRLTAVQKSLLDVLLFDNVSRAATSHDPAQLSWHGFCRNEVRISMRDKFSRNNRPDAFSILNVVRSTPPPSNPYSKWKMLNLSYRSFFECLPVQEAMW